jgi:hypothetical protein
MQFRKPLLYPLSYEGVPARTLTEPQPLSVPGGTDWPPSGTKGLLRASYCRAAVRDPVGCSAQGSASLRGLDYAV